jgi:hypothetical protein
MLALTMQIVVLSPHSINNPMHTEMSLIILILSIAAVCQLVNIPSKIEQTKDTAKMKLANLKPDQTWGTGMTQFRRDHDSLKEDIESAASSHLLYVLISIGIKVWIVTWLLRAS